MGLKNLSLLVLVVVCAASLSRHCDAALAPALFVLGDSTVDTGNQDYITTVFKSNYPPYGMNFVPPGPTGRFSNGKLANDFIAEYLGLPLPINYLDPKATGPVLLTGVNLASSGSAYLDTTNTILGAHNMTTQLDNLGTVKQEIIQQIGEPATEDLFSKSIFLVSTGTTDFIVSYPVLQQQYTEAQYEQLVLGSVNSDLQKLYNFGARKVIINSMGPVGCTPEQINFSGSQDGTCVLKLNQQLQSFNVVLNSLVFELRHQYPDFHLLYSNIYDPVYEFAVNPTSHGFKYGNTACCGEGPYKGLPCIQVSDVCADPDDYVFWDLLHPTQHTYQIISNSMISGDPSAISPTNLNGIL